MINSQDWTDEGETYLPTRLGRYFEGGLESSSLLGCEDCPWPFRSSWVFPVITALPRGHLSLSWFDVPILIITFHC